MAFASNSRGKHSIIICFNQKCKKIQLKINNELIKAFKASDKAFVDISDYKWTFLVNGWLWLLVSRGKQLITICFNQKIKKNEIKFNYGIIKAFKASNKAFEGMGDYKRTFPFNGGF